jgi:hypothetical protein
MDQIPDEYRGNRCVAVLRMPVGDNWQYYIRVGESIKAMEKDMEDRRHRYGYSFIKLPGDKVPQEKDVFLARFEQVNVSFLDLVVDMVSDLNSSKKAKTSPLDSVTIDDILAMQKKKGPAKSKKDDSPVLGI